MFVKTVSVECKGCTGWKYPYDTTRFIKEYRADNGKSIYKYYDRIVTRDEANEIYKEICSDCKSHKAKATTVKATDEEIIKRFEDAIDPYTAYIDDWEQEQEANAYNELMRNLIAKFKKVAERND